MKAIDSVQMLTDSAFFQSGFINLLTETVKALTESINMFAELSPAPGGPGNHEEREVESRARPSPRHDGARMASPRTRRTGMTTNPEEEGNPDQQEKENLKLSRPTTGRRWRRFGRRSLPSKVRCRQPCLRHWTRST